MSSMGHSMDSGHSARCARGGGHEGTTMRWVSERRGLRAAITALALAGGTGCASTLPYDRYEPRPAEVDVQQPGDVGRQLARALVSVLGIRRVGEGGPLELSVRLRVESHAEMPLVWRADRTRLVSADLRAFGEARVEPSPVPPIAPGTLADLQLVFPFPGGVEWREVDLTSVHLTWALEVGDQLVTVGTTFKRSTPDYPRRSYHHDPWWDPWYPWWDPYWGRYYYAPYSSVRASVGLRFHGH